MRCRVSINEAERRFALLDCRLSRSETDVNGTLVSAKPLPFTSVSDCDKQLRSELLFIVKFTAVQDMDMMPFSFVAKVGKGI